MSVSWTRRFLTTFDAVCDGFAFWMLLLTFALLLPVNPIFAILCLLSSFDQFDDVYYDIYRRHIYPSRLIFEICNILLELVCLLVAVGLEVFTSIYFIYFPTPFWLVAHLLAFCLVWSSVRDLFTRYGKKRRRVRNIFDCYV